MKWFKKMIEVATDLGIYWMEDDDHLPRKCDPSMFFNRIEKCYPFVFVPTHNEEPEKLEHKGKVEIDPPFEVMSIEMLGDCAISVMDDGDKDLPVDIADIYCIMNCEFSDKDGIHYGQFFLVKYKETRSTGDWMVISTGLLSSMVKSFLIESIQKKMVWK